MSTYELIDWTYPPPGEGPGPYFGYDLDRETGIFIAHRPPATPMTSIVTLELNKTADLQSDASWNETLKAISTLEGWIFTIWGNSLEAPSVVMVLIGKPALLNS